MPRFRLGSFKTPSFIQPMPMPFVEGIGISLPLSSPSEPCPLTDEQVAFFRELTAETINRCCRAMRNGTPGEPTSSEKGVLRRIANEIGVDDVIALSWSPTYKLYFP